jgi:hypothetical protein
VVPAKPRLPRTGRTVLDGLGRPVLGARHGAPDVVDWSALAAQLRPGRVAGMLRHRRWVYAVAATDELLVALAVVDGATTGTAFCMVTDVRTGEVLVDSSRPGANGPLVEVSDHPAEGLDASYRLPGTDYRIVRQRGSSQTQIRVRLRRTRDSLPGLRLVPGISSAPWLRDLPTAQSRPWVDIDLVLESGVAPPLTAVSQLDVEGGLVTSTVKTAAMPAWGTVTVHDDEQGVRRCSLDGGTGGLDYTNGYLPRRLQWQWAYATGRLADGRLFGINLVSNFSGTGDAPAENAVWLDGALVPLDPRARILHDPGDRTRPWLVRTVDSGVHLRFTPVAEHSESLNLGVLRSRFVQPTGTFDGHVMVEGQRVEVSGLPGVVEDQDILW